MWTFFPTATATSALDIVTSADLSIVKAHTGAFTVGQIAAYTLTIANAGRGVGCDHRCGRVARGMTFVSGGGPGLDLRSLRCERHVCERVGSCSGSLVGCHPDGRDRCGRSAVRRQRRDGQRLDRRPIGDEQQLQRRGGRDPRSRRRRRPRGDEPGTPVSIGVLANDGLGVGPTSITSHTAAGNGTVGCTATDCSYTPNAGFSGGDSFRYTITDANGRTSTATVTISVAPPPATDADLATTVRGPATASRGEPQPWSQTCGTTARAPRAPARS